MIPLPALFHDCVVCCWQVLEGRSHALLQEKGVSLVDIIREESFYMRERRMSAPMKSRQEVSFGSALPIELPTEAEMDRAAQQCALLHPPALSFVLPQPILVCTVARCPAGCVRPGRASGTDWLPSCLDAVLASREARGCCRSGLKGLRRLVSPVFFSRTRDGRVQRGLDGLPSSRPLLLVGNHQVKTHPLAAAPPSPHAQSSPRNVICCCRR